MDLYDRLEHLLHSMKFDDIPVEIMKRTSDTVVIEVDHVEPQALLRTKIMDTAYSDEIDNERSNNEQTVLIFRHTHVNKKECNVSISITASADKTIFAARIVTYVDYDENGQYNYI